MRAVKQQKGLEFFQLHTHLAGCATEALVLLLVHFPIALFFLHFGPFASVGKGRSWLLVTELLARIPIFFLFVEHFQNTYFNTFFFFLKIVQYAHVC